MKIPAAILRKPSLLTADEMTLVQEHAQHGHDMLMAAGQTDELLLTVIRDHHERLDGSGYPRQLTALGISTPVRIVTLCDVFAVMTEPRRYGTVMQWDEALDRMSKKRTRLDLDLLADFATIDESDEHTPKAVQSVKKPFQEKLAITTIFQPVHKDEQSIPQLVHEIVRYLVDDEGAIRVDCLDGTGAKRHLPPLLTYLMILTRSA